jgi:hypothetical protein
VRVKATRSALGISNRVGADALARADRTDPANANLAVTDRALLDHQLLLAVFALYDARGAVTELGVDVIVPEVEGLEDVAVGVNHLVHVTHSPLLCGGRSSRTDAIRTGPCLLPTK